jgi:phosphinothricin acetyltransferase
LLVATRIELRDLRPDDWPEVARIFAQGIATRNATFETQVPSWEEWDASHLPEHRLVALDGERMVGWIALMPASTRKCYAGVAEVSVYVGEDTRGQGVGARLVEAAIARSEEAGIWTLQTAIFPENVPSLALCQRFGFRVVGRRDRIAKLDRRWRDTLVLERRSEEVT